MTEKIDFVVLWVDGEDPEWQREKARFEPEYETSASSINRYRDWDLMRYWFRGVEKYAPWVNRIFFVTSGQIPEWLKADHPKLRLVEHREYIPKQYLPTFNSNVIELRLHHIADLSEHFVLFNDDMFLTAPVKPEDFFLLRTYAGPSALVECGFLSNPKDEALLLTDDFKRAVADAIVQGTIAYLSSVSA